MDMAWAGFDDFRVVLFLRSRPEEDGNPRLSLRRLCDRRDSALAFHWFWRRVLKNHDKEARLETKVRRGLGWGDEKGTAWKRTRET